MSDLQRKVHGKDVLAFCAAVAALLLGLELGLRLIGFEHHRAEIPMIIWNPADDAQFASDEGLHQTAVHQLWAPRPGARNPYGGKDELINAAGYRGPLLSDRPAPGVLRIATLGDSSTFGLGVAYPETYSARLAAALSRRGPAEVLCAGVIGYSARQGLERYRQLVRAYRPSVVVAAFGAVNDHFPAQGLTDSAKIERNVERSTPIRRGWRGLQRELRVLNLTAYLADALRGREGASREDMMRDRRAYVERLRRDRRIAGRVDFAGPRRVSPVDFEESLRTLAHETARDGARLILVSMPRSEELDRSRPVLGLYSETIARVSEDEGLDWVPARGVYRRLIASGGAGEDDLLQDRVHPTPRGHQVIADELTPLILR